MLRGVKRRTLVYVAAGIGALALVWIVGDLVIVTDAERIAPLIDDIGGEVTPARIDAVLAWTDPERQPVEIQALGRTELFEERAALSTRAHEGLRPVQGDTFRILGESIDVEDDRATVSLRLLSGQGGMTSVFFDLRKRDDDWLIEKVRVER
jgi:hypothetical protein